MDSNNHSIPKHVGELRHLTKLRPKKPPTRKPQLEQNLRRLPRDMRAEIGNFALTNALQTKSRTLAAKKNKVMAQTDKMVNKVLATQIEPDPTRPDWNWGDDVLIPRLKAYYRDRDLTESKGVHDDDNPENWSPIHQAQANKRLTLARKFTKPFKKPPGPANRRLPKKYQRKVLAAAAIKRNK